jgi:hypothetical protein
LHEIKTDLVVVGGGVAGSVAALAAANLGVDVILVEKNGFLGGTATAALVGPPQTFHAGEEQIISGLPQKIIDKLVKLGASPGHVYDMIGFVSTITPVDSEMFKIVLEEILLAAGVKLMYHSTLINVEKDNDLISSTIVRSKLKEYRIKGEVFIDSTGDSELITLAGAPYQVGRASDQKTQPMSTMFKVGGIDFAPIREAIKKNPDDFLLSRPRQGMDPWEFPYCSVNGFFSVIEKAKANGDFNIPRDRVLFFQQPTPGVATVNMTRVIEKSPLDGEDLSRAELEARRQVVKILNFMQKYLPGFENSYLLSIGSTIGVRESKRLIGEYTLTGEDLVRGRRFDTAISRGSYPIDIHSPDGSEMDIISMEEGTWYHIPRETTFTSQVPNLLAAGRNISTTHEAHASTRIQPSAMAIGQGVGTNAALAIKNKQYPAEVKIKALQDQLVKDGAII